MLFNPYLYRGIFKCLILSLILSTSACTSDANNPLGLSNNQIAYFLDQGTERTYECTATLIQNNEDYTFKIKGSEKSDGIIITIKNVKPYQPNKYAFYKDVSIILNDKSDDELMVYVSTGCKMNQGIFEIVEWNKDASTITGIFNGPVCTRGIFAHLPGAVIKEGAFYKMKYNER